ncbi:uncharacterized protein LOC105687924 [Athalia rosae]|uniref:uncharacterized protein LOC105687924 n=1 Tax=Athalia rosae TaxID=37344 RepID=UPI00062612D3|nr:uncharacterized protein LOC105687924 [Athalia rosae]XP_048511122.1 uncharacterized protein LOC105687924 [Athalia rosae]
MFNSIRFLILVGLISSTCFAWPQEKKFEKERGVQVGSMLAEVAKELIQRSSSNSQVLSLNLSSLLVLLVLKAVVFGAGYMGHHGFKAREVDEESIVTESEIALALGYLLGENCLYRAACEVPHKAKEYLGAAEMILQAIRFMPESFKVDTNYVKMVSELKKAIEYGTAKQCPPQYTCKKENINNFLQSA